MSSQNQPTAEQLKPMVEHNRTFWVGFMKATAIGGAAIIVLLVLMLVFLVKHN